MINWNQAKTRTVKIFADGLLGEEQGHVELAIEIDPKALETLVKEAGKSKINHMWGIEQIIHGIWVDRVRPEGDLV